MKVKIHIAESAFEKIITQLNKDGLCGIENIGKVYLPGSHNNWGDSPMKAGCIIPKEEDEMYLFEGDYIWEGDVPVGVMLFKPVVVISGADSNGFVSCKWISDSNGSEKHGNWRLVVK